jgi:PEP-CTERM motif
LLRLAFTAPEATIRLASAIRDSIDYAITPFGIDGIDGTPYFFFQGTLDNPIFLQNGGRYYVGVAGFAMVGGGPDVAWRTLAFSTGASVLFPRNPGVAIQVVGQVVPEPSTIVLLGLGMMLLCLHCVSVQSLTR